MKGDFDGMAEKLASFGGLDPNSLHFEIIDDDTEEGMQEQINRIVKDRKEVIDLNDTFFIINV